MLKHTKKTSIIVICLLLLVGCRNNNDQLTHGYIEGRFTYISSQVGGVLKRLHVKKGDSIKFNQPLFELDPKPEDSMLQLARAKLSQAKARLANLEKGKRPTEIAAILAQQKQILAQLKYAKITVERYQQLYNKKVFDRSRLDEAIAHYKNLQAKLTEIESNLKTARLTARIDEIDAAKSEVIAFSAELEKAKWKIQQKIISALIAGHVYDTYYDTSEVIPANNPVLSILDPHNVYAVFYVPEKEFSPLHLGQKVKITCDGTTQTFTAKISFLSPQAEYTPPIIYSEKSRPKLIYRVEAELTPDDAITLHPGQPITVEFSTMENDYAKG